MIEILPAFSVPIKPEEVIKHFESRVRARSEPQRLVTLLMGGKLVAEKVWLSSEVANEQWSMSFYRHDSVTAVGPDGTPRYYVESDSGTEAEVFHVRLERKPVGNETHVQFALYDEEYRGELRFLVARLLPHSAVLLDYLDVQDATHPFTSNRHESLRDETGQRLEDVVTQTHDQIDPNGLQQSEPEPERQAIPRKRICEDDDKSRVLSAIRLHDEEMFTWEEAAEEVGISGGRQLYRLRKKYQLGITRQ